VVEADTGAERLTPGQELMSIIDAHFTEVGGKGKPGLDGQELIELYPSGGVGAFGIIDPTSIRAARPMLGRVDAAPETRTDFKGYQVISLGYNTEFTECTSCFARDHQIWVRGSLTHRDTHHTEDAEAVLDPQLARSFLDWLKQATPFLIT